MNLPLKFLLLMWAGWVNRAQQDAIDYLKEENRILREQMDNKRLRLNKAQKRRLAQKAKVVGRRERNHQGLDNRLIESRPKDVLTQGPVLRRERLGGMLSYYYREAA